MKYIYSLTASLLIAVAACTPDEYSMGAKTYSSEDLVQGVAYTVTPDAEDPNTIHLVSLLGSDITPLWETPSGRSQATSLDLELPFEGSYSVTYGVQTPGGIVWGAPYTFTIVGNNFNMLSDEKWADLAGGVEKSRKWVPIDKDYGIGRCTGPVMYMSPTDVKNDGSGVTDVAFGSDNWAPNWDPGLQSWLIPEGDPYFESYMTFGLSAKNGCTAEVYRNAASGATLMNGKFNLNLADSKHPVITFIDCYSLHNEGFDEVCSNYTQEIKIIELTDYLLQLATMRTNSEGAWWIVWNFISEEAKNDPSLIPTDEIQTIDPTAVQEPSVSDLATKLFTTDINGVTYVGNEMTFLIDEEKPYDWMWWNGGSSAWEGIVSDYNSTWAPAAPTTISSFELVLGKNVKNESTEYTWDDGTNNGIFTIDGNQLKFYKVEGEGDNKTTTPAEVTFFTATCDARTVEIKDSAFTVIACDPASSITLGIPASTNADGAIDSYLSVNLTYKPVVSSTGPTEVKIDNSTIAEHAWVENGCIRIGFHHYGEEGTGIFQNASSVKLKKDETITVKFKINSGITWTATPKCALIDNNIKQTWEPGCFDLSDAVEVNLNGETTVSLKNTLGSTVTFTGTCLDLSIQYNGYGTANTLGEDGNPDFTTVDIEIVSCTIQ